MELILPSHMVWWVTVIDIPVTSALFIMLWRVRKDTDDRMQHLQNMLEVRSAQFRDLLSSYKLEVAKTYSTQSEMRNLEGRLVSHLLRIESKLDSHVERNLREK